MVAQHEETNLKVSKSLQCTKGWISKCDCTRQVVVFVPMIICARGLAEVDCNFNTHSLERWTAEKKPKWFWNNWARPHRRKLLPSWQHLSSSGIFLPCGLGFVSSALDHFPVPARRNCVLTTDSQEYLSLGSSLMQVLGMNHLTIFPEAAQCTDKSMRLESERVCTGFFFLNLPCMRPCSWLCFNAWYHIWSPEHCLGCSWAQSQEQCPRVPPDVDHQNK